MNDVVAREVEKLRATGYTVEAVEADGYINLLFTAFLLPVGYNKSTTELLVMLPVSYPNGSPDMFWTDTDLLLVSGSVPQSAEAIEPRLGKQRRRFSWHPQGWSPAVSNITTYLEFINRRLVKGV